MSGQLTWTTWYGQSGKRWPMTLGLWLGVAMAIYTTAMGYGYRLAQEQLPITRAAVIARNQPAVPDELNAAIYYDQATAVFVPWKQLATQLAEASTIDQPISELDPERIRSEDWRKGLMFSPDSSLRTYLRANHDAMALALAGTQLPDVDWGIPAENFPAAPLTRLTNLSPLIRLLSKRALMSAHEGDWETAIFHMQAMARGAAHARRGIGTMPYLLSSGMSNIIWTTARESLALPGIVLDEVTLKALQVLAVEESTMHIMDIHRALTDEMLVCEHVMDQVAIGDFSRITQQTGKKSTFYVPNTLNLYSAVYPWDRGAFAELMQNNVECFLALAEKRKTINTAIDAERAYYTDPRFIYSALFGPSLSGMLLPMSGLYKRMEEDRQIKWRTLTAAIELQLWILRTQRIPMSLAETDISAEVLTDPLADGKLFLIQREEDHLLRLWSIGRNKVDDTTLSEAHTRSDDITIFIRLPKDLP
jgi:hypothetical protein